MATVSSGCEKKQSKNNSSSYFRKAFTQLYQNKNTNNIIPSSEFHPQHAIYIDPDFVSI